MSAREQELIERLRVIRAALVQTGFVLNSGGELTPEQGERLRKLAAEAQKIDVELRELEARPASAETHAAALRRARDLRERLSRPTRSPPGLTQPAMHSLGF